MNSPLKSQKKFPLKISPLEMYIWKSSTSIRMESGSLKMCTFSCFTLRQYSFFRFLSFSSS